MNKKLLFIIFYIQKWKRKQQCQNIKKKRAYAMKVLILKQNIFYPNFVVYVVLIKKNEMKC